VKGVNYEGHHAEKRNRLHRFLLLKQERWYCNGQQVFKEPQKVMKKGFDGKPLNPFFF